MAQFTNDGDLDDTLVENNEGPKQTIDANSPSDPAPGDDLALAEEEEGEEQGASSGDAAVGGALAKAGSTALGAAKGAGRSLAGGLCAMRDVRRAAKQRANAQADLRDIERGLAEDRDLLAHREDVERNFDDIVYAQTTELNDANAEAQATSAAIAEQQSLIEQLNDELRRMRERHEQKLRPYRNLMDSSRGRADDAAKALAATKRAHRSAEAAVADATKRRDQRISSAHRTVDNAQERLTAVAGELQQLSADESASPAALAKVQSELASEQAHLESAQADVATITQDAQNAVDQAQQSLWSVQRDLAAAEKAAESTKVEATARKEEYDGMYRDAQAKERAHEESIKLAEQRVRDLNKSLEASQQRAQAATELLDEANEIHAHPETTQGLRERIANEESDLAYAQADLDDLSATERELRRSTLGSRVAVIVAAVIALVIIAVLVWFFLIRK